MPSEELLFFFVMLSPKFHTSFHTTSLKFDAGRANLYSLPSKPSLVGFQSNYQLKPTPNFASQMRMISTRVFVGNLAWSTTEDELKDLFAQHGSIVSVRIVQDRESGRAKGFGFIEFAEENSANTAITSLNGKEFLGRDLRVSKANPPRPREQL